MWNLRFLNVFENPEVLPVMTKSMTKKFVEHELLGKHLGGPLYGANRQILVEVTVFQCFWETGSTSGNDRKLKTSPLNSPYTN